MKYLSKIASVLTILFFGSVGLFAQAPDTAWTRTYGGTDADYGYSVQQTTDGGYIVAGYTESYGVGGWDVYLIKTNSLGDTLWTRTYGGTDYDRGYSVQQTTDGGYIVAGYTQSYGAGYEDVYLIKTNSLGDTLWTRTYGGTSSDRGYSVQQTTDGGYIVAGWTFSYGASDGNDVYLIKINSSGNVLWAKTFGQADKKDEGYSVQQTTDGGYIITGRAQTYSLDFFDVYLIKTDSLGGILWMRTYQGGDYDCGESVQQTTDGGYIVAGYTWFYGAIYYRYVYLIKTNSSGDTLWTRTYGGGFDQGNSVQQTTDGGYIVAGGAGSDDVYLIKTNSSGDTLWTRTYGGASGDVGYSVQQTTDGGYIVAGHTGSYGAGESDVYLIKIKPEEGGIGEEKTTGLFHLSSADPNPFTSETTVQYELTRETNLTISVYNMLGQKVRALFSGRQSPGVCSISWDGRGDSGEKSSSGIYFVRVEAEGKEASRKVMFVR